MASVAADEAVMSAVGVEPQVEELADQQTAFD